MTKKKTFTTFFYLFESHSYIHFPKKMSLHLNKDSFTLMEQYRDQNLKRLDMKFKTNVGAETFFRHFSSSFYAHIFRQINHKINFKKKYTHRWIYVQKHLYLFSL